MTGDPYSPEERPSRLRGADLLVAVAAIAALTLPFIMRGMANSSHATAQVAEHAEVSPIRPIDLAMGHDAAQAEAAFYEALGQRVPDPSSPAGEAVDALPDNDDPSDLIEAAADDAPEDAYREENAEENGSTSARPGSIAEALGIAPSSSPDPAPANGDFDMVLSGDTDVPAEFADDLEAAAIGGVDEEPETALPDPTLEAPSGAPPQEAPLPRARPSRPSDATAIAAALPRDPVPGVEEAPLPPPLDALPEAVGPSADATRGEEEDAGVPAAATLPGLFEDAALIVASPSDPKPAVAPEPEQAPGQGPRIALVISAAGLHPGVTRFAIESLPGGITFAFAPVKPEIGAIAQEAKRDGHTVLVEIPMEPVNRQRDPGPLTLRVADPVEANLDRLEEALSRIPAASGASSYLGARFTAVEGAADPIIKSLAQRGLFFFENQPTERSVLERLSVRSQLPYAKGVIVIDRSKSATAIRASLDALEKRARERGVAIGVGTMLRSTVSTLALWAEEAEKRGIEFTPVTTLGGARG